jgi:hypothetical protein
MRGAYCIGKVNAGCVDTEKVGTRLFVGFDGGLDERDCGGISIFLLMAVGSIQVSKANVHNTEMDIPTP